MNWIFFFVAEIIALVVGMLFGSIIGIDYERRKLYDKDGRCKECGHPKVEVPDHADGYRWEQHHPNCPIGRLGA